MTDKCRSKLGPTCVVIDLDQEGESNQDCQLTVVYQLAATQYYNRFELKDPQHIVAFECVQERHGRFMNINRIMKLFYFNMYLEESYS